MQVALKYKQLNEAENKNKTLQFALRTWTFNRARERWHECPKIKWLTQSRNNKWQGRISMKQQHGESSTEYFNFAIKRSEPLKARLSLFTHWTSSASGNVISAIARKRAGESECVCKTKRCYLISCYAKKKTRKEIKRATERENKWRLIHF